MPILLENKSRVARFLACKCMVNGTELRNAWKLGINRIESPNLRVFLWICSIKINYGNFLLRKFWELSSRTPSSRTVILNCSTSPSRGGKVTTIYWSDGASAVPRGGNSFSESNFALSVSYCWHSMHRHAVCTVVDGIFLLVFLRPLVSDDVRFLKRKRGSRFYDKEKDLLRPFTCMDFRPAAEIFGAKPLSKHPEWLTLNARKLFRTSRKRSSDLNASNQQ